jgi:TP901 family phage tail tape measure protein
MSDGNARFQEVIEVILDSNKAEKEVKAFVKRFKDEFAKGFKGAENTKFFKDMMAEASEAQRQMLEKMSKDRVRAVKDAARAEAQEEKKRAEAIKKINDDLRRADEQRRKQETAENAAHVARQMAEVKRAAAAEESAAQKRANAIAKINRDVARQDAARRRQEERENIASIERQMAAARRAAAEQERLNARLVRSQIRRTRAAATPAVESSEGGVRGSQIASGLRAGAGAAGAMGAFRGSSAMYGMANVASQLGAISMSATALIGTLAGLGTAVVGVGGAFAMLSHSADFDKKLAEMSTLLESATVANEAFAGSLDRTAVAAADLSVKFNRDLLEVVAGFKEALSSGIKAEELVAFSEHAGQLSAALGISFKDASNVLTSFKDAYQLSIGDLARVNDILFNTVDQGKVNIDELVHNFGRLLPVGHAAGISLEDLAAGVAVLTRQGMTASQSITSMISLIEKTVNPSDKAKEAFKQFGIEFGQTAFGNGGILGFIDQLKSKTGGSLDILGEMFRERQAKRGITALIQGNELLAQTNQLIRERGTAEVAQQRALDSTVIKVEQLQKAIGNEFALAGRQLWDSLGAIFLGDGPLSDSVLTDVQTTVINIIGAFKTFGIVVGTVAKVVWDLVRGLWNIATLDFAEAGKAFGTVIETAAAGTEQLMKSFQDTADRLDQVKHKTEAAGGATSQAVDHIVNKWSDVSDAVDEAGGSLDELHKKLEKIKEKEVEDRARDSQSTQLEEIKDSIVKYEVALAEQMKQVRSRVAAEVEAIKKEIEGQSDFGNFGGGQAGKQAYLDRMGEVFTNRFESDTAIPELRQKLSDLKTQLEQMTNQILTQQTDAIFDAQLQKLEDHYALVEENVKKTREKMKSAAESYKSDVVNLAEKYYQQDAKNYEKWQEKKLKTLEKLQKKMERILDKHAAKTNEIMGEKSKNALAGAGDDPARQKRVATDQYNAAKEALDDYIGKGGGNASEEFDRLMDAVRQASDAIFNAEERLAGASRAATNKDARLSEEQTYNDAAKNNAVRQNNAAAQAANAGAPPAPNYQSAAAKAASEMATQNVIRNEVVNVDVKLGIDGTVSKETQQAIADAVYKTLERNRKNQTERSDYDKSTYGEDD